MISKNINDHEIVKAIIMKTCFSDCPRCNFMVIMRLILSRHHSMEPFLKSTQCICIMSQEKEHIKVVKQRFTLAQFSLKSRLPEWREGYQGHAPKFEVECATKQVHALFLSTKRHYRKLTSSKTYLDICYFDKLIFYVVLMLALIKILR